MDDFVGVYVTPEREIHIGRESSVEDLLYVIRKLADEVEVWRSRCLQRPFPISKNAKAPG